MTMMDLYVEEGAISDDSLQALALRSSLLALRYEGFEGSRVAADFAWVYTHIVPASRVTQASGKPRKPLYRVEITTINGLTDQASKTRLAGELARLIYELEDSRWDAAEAVNRVWTLFRDVREGGWINGDVMFSASALRAQAERDR